MKKSVLILIFAIFGFSVVAQEVGDSTKKSKYTPLKFDIRPTTDSSYKPKNEPFTYRKRNGSNDTDKVKTSIPQYEMRTILKSPISNGGYGSFSIRYAGIDGKDGLEIGGRGVWIMNHCFGIGLGGYGIFNQPEYNALLDTTNDVKYNLGGGYGGIILEPVIGSKYAVHLAFPILIGAGGISYTRQYIDNNDWNNDMQNINEDADAYFVVQPGCELELNLLKYMRLGFGVYYRYTSNINLETTRTSPSQRLVPKNVLQDLSYGITFKFGSF